ncbi:putative toxin-antitoxin system toxin component, PIN family [Candidatus Pacearchaeota archaeon RBG_13_36_9]|nr:MAG: putative toxin-antitoxin system toxin component, PIN family [Candidatus Pacearchaeota archaeon RBG_13_36_9]
MKIVLDTNVLISSTLWDNSVAQKFLFKCIKENVQIFSSQDIIEEYKEILVRDFNYGEQKIGEILQRVLRFLALVTPSQKIDAVKEDADDNKIIECAVECKANFILSYDNHLLKLKEYQGIKIAKPEEAFRLIFSE